MAREYTIDELKELIVKAKAGDKEPFAVIYEQFYTPIFRYLYGRTGDKNLAEDLTQDVFLKGYRSLNNYMVSASSPLAYFYTIARNCLIDHWRKIAPERLSENYLEVLPDPEASTDRLALAREAEKILEIGLSALTVVQREVLTLKYLNELSTREIAEILDKKEEAIRQIIVRALRAMSQKLEKYGN
ncbi:MAG: RNA polymerase sigma factor [Candidatus Paceibacterota bacterium]|jgi:RNA polymerase sigma-70 factor (ECF subfamily)